MSKSRKKPAKPVSNSARIAGLGSRIKELRIKKGYASAEKFALDHELSRVQMGRWEQGKNIRIETVFRLADAFEMTASELLKGL